VKTTNGDYQAWTSIDYQPAIAELYPRSVLPYLKPNDTALDVGCNKGGVSLFLVNHGVGVLGIDINQAAIEVAKRRAAEAGLEGSVRFLAADIIEEPPAVSFNLVLLIRVLTCFPNLTQWESLLEKARSLVQPNGFIYIHDFLIAHESQTYRTRYEAGAQQGWRQGSFAVSGPTGDPLFIAHHHSDAEVASIVAPYERVHYDIHESLSMNGNVCRMFEFLGRRVK
jgi:cyclopropane fatty-acyl-phospholipid synthase-like methyltransferase